MKTYFSRKMALITFGMCLLGFVMMFFYVVNNAEASSYEISGSITPTENLSNVWYIGRYANDEKFYIYLGSFEVNKTTTYSFSINSDSAPAKYMLAGIYTDDDHTGVTIGSNEILAGESWYDIVQSYSGVDEDTAIYVLTHDLLADPEYQHKHIFRYLGEQYGVQVALWNFSDASSGGSAISNVTCVSEPTAMLLIGFGLTGLAGLRRKIK